MDIQEHGFRALELLADNVDNTVVMEKIGVKQLVKKVMATANASDNTRANTRRCMQLLLDKIQDSEREQTVQAGRARTEKALRQLTDMGFKDTKRNKVLLEELHFDLDKVIDQLTLSPLLDADDSGDSSCSGNSSRAVIATAWKVCGSALVWKDKLDSGSFGSVHAVDWHGVAIAAKKMRYTVDSERDAIERMLLREFRALQQLQHPHIVRMHGVVERELVLLMELSELGSLCRLLKTSPESVLKSQPAQFSLLIGIARGMAFLHNQNPVPILHHDLKSDYVLVWQDAGSKFIAKIADFGLATGTLASNMKTTRSGAGAATLAYKAPEAFDDEFSTASEVYAYGIIGWEVLTGKVPWEGYSELKLMKDVAILGKRLLLPTNIVTAPLGQMVQRWWAQEPMKRPVFAEIVTRLVGAVKYIPTNQSVEVRLPGTWSAVNDVQLAQMVAVDVGAERKEVEAAFGRTLAGRGMQVWHTGVAYRCGIQVWHTGVAYRWCRCSASRMSRCGKYLQSRDT